MSVPVPSCSNCGKNFTTDDLRLTACKHCGTVLDHHRRAAQQVAVINEMMADRNGNGIPDAFEPMVQNARAAAVNQAFGVGPNPYAPMAPTPYAPNPYAPSPYARGATQAATAAAATGMAAAGIAVIVGVVVLALFFAGGIAAYILLR